MIGLDRVYPFGMEVRVSRGHFYHAVQDSQRVFAEGNGCVSTAFYDVI